MKKIVIKRLFEVFVNEDGYISMDLSDTTPQQMRRVSTMLLEQAEFKENYNKKKEQSIIAESLKKTDN